MTKIHVGGRALKIGKGVYMYLCQVIPVFVISVLKAIISALTRGSLKRPKV